MKFTTENCNRIVAYCEKEYNAIPYRITNEVRRYFVYGDQKIVIEKDVVVAQLRVVDEPNCDISYMRNTTPVYEVQAEIYTSAGVAEVFIISLIWRAEK